MYAISSETGYRHMVAGPMPANGEVLDMWHGKTTAHTMCGRHLTPVNFYDEADSAYGIVARYLCSKCFGTQKEG